MNRFVFASALTALACMACQDTAMNALPQTQAHLAPNEAAPEAAPSSSNMLACTDTSSLAIFENRIAPLLGEDRPSSCNRCHLSGLDLKLFVRNSPCEAMACLLENELVDFEDPKESTILTWITRTNPEEEVVTDAFVAQEYEGFLEWITYSAACYSDTCGDEVVCTDERPNVEVDPDPEMCEGGSCLPQIHPCIEGDLRPECMTSNDPCNNNPLLPECAPEMSEPCSERALSETVLFNILKPWRGRCEHCHEPESIINVGNPPKWLEQEDTREDAWATLMNLEELGAFDLEDPANSTLILKPLAEAEGGVRHGGGTKMLSKEDPSYRNFLRVAEHYAFCYGPDSPTPGE